MSDSKDHEEVFDLEKQYFTPKNLSVPIHNIEGMEKVIQRDYPTLLENFKEWQKDLYMLFVLKQFDYGPKNIAKFGEIGVLVRLSDKVERLINLNQTSRLGGTTPANESVDDTWKDISVYAIIALLCRHNNWPGVK